MNKWGDYYLRLAHTVGTMSKDPSMKVGAVVVADDGQILSTGFNGFPRGIADTNERLCNRELKYKYIVHAEMNAIYNASLSGVSLKNSTIYVDGLPPCSQCALGIIQSGISCVVVRDFDINNIERWKESIALTEEIFDEAGITLLKINNNGEYNEG